MTTALLLLWACGGANEDPGPDPRLSDEPEDRLPCDGTREVREPTADEIAIATSAECEMHADCTEGLNGRCVVDPEARYPEGDTVIVCSYDGCVADEDCDAGSICICENDSVTERSFCVAADCRTDADCRSGERCRVETAACEVRETGRHCTTDDDGCDPVDDACPDWSKPDWPVPGTCLFVESRWECGYQSCYD
jgi:hypothetical protein